MLARPNYHAASEQGQPTVRIRVSGMMEQDNSSPPVTKNTSTRVTVRICPERTTSPRAFTVAPSASGIKVELEFRREITFARLKLGKGCVTVL